jgi:hypothetical protein
MDAFQLAAAKQALLDTEIRKHRSSSFSAHVSHVVESANSRLAVAAAARPTDTSDSTLCAAVGDTSASSQKPVTKILGGIVDRHENFNSMAYTKSPPPQCFGSVSVIEGHAPERREAAESNSNLESGEDTQEKGGARAEAGGAKVSDEPEKVVDAPKLVMVTTSGLPASYLPGFKGRKHRGALKNLELTSGLVYVDGPYGRRLR